MKISLILSAVLGVVVISCANKPAPTANKVKNIELRWFGTPEEQFVEDLELAFERLNRFLKKENLSQTPVESYVYKVIYFESKDIFDSEIIRLTKGQMKTIPKTYVAFGDGGILRTISLKAYLKVHPDHTRKDFIDLLVHEAAHIFHSKKYGDEGMGPIWFFEGFAVVAADQYFNDVKLSKDEMKAVAAAKRRGDYKKYGFMVRELKKTHSIGDMLQKAKDEPSKFLNYLKLN